MKKLAIVLVVLLGFGAYSQNQSLCNDRGIKNQFTVEQNADLRSKRIALHLDLNSDQQKKVYKLVLKQAQDLAPLKTQMLKDRVAGKQPTSDEHFSLMTKGLDAKLVFQNELKSILTPTQFENWKKNNETTVKSHFNKSKKNHQRGTFK